jgi:glucose/arabinose dehydrogenase
MKKIIITTSVVAVAVAVVAAFLFSNPVAWFFQPSPESESAATTTAEIVSRSESRQVQEAAGKSITTIADNLSVPWGIAFLPNGNILLTERTGSLLELSVDGEILKRTIIGAEQQGESGLLGIALHPEFEQNNWLYIYRTITKNDGLENEIVRYKYDSRKLTKPKVIIDGISGAMYHDGGRMAFDSDRYLFVLTGDATDPDLAQRTDALEGKVLRVHEDGAIPEDNPFGNAVYSYGHRNPQGLAWHASGQLFVTEHGRSGVRSGLDEINLIQAGGNYGWPYLEGDETCGQDGVYNPAWPVDDDCNGVPPLEHSGKDITWAPASAAIVGDSLFYGGLRGQALYEARIINTGTEIQVGNIQTHFKNKYGRIRTVIVDPSGQYLYITTSNTDGRGNPSSVDDRLIRIPISVF